MLSEYPRGFVDPVIKPSTRNLPTTDRVYQGTVVIPYVKGISRKSNASGTVSISETFSRLNIHSVGH
jgi:hypothetical protein